MFTRRFVLAFAVIGGLHAVAIWAAWHSTSTTPTTPATPPPLPITIRIAPVVTAQIEAAPTPVAPQATTKKSVPTVKKTAEISAPTPVENTSTPSAFSEALPTAAEPSDLPQSASPPEPPLPLYKADYVSNPAPEYPKLSRKYREEGVVDVRVLVNPDGSAEQVELAQSSGFSRLDKAALTAVKQWRFLPQRQDTTLISSWIVVPVRFDLQQKESVRG